MKFDFVIGNPPYQETTESDSTRMPPVYDKFMEAAFEIAERVELIHPARFLFDAGFTPHNWNIKMLNDEHFKILKYEADCTKVFANTDIKGGLAISYRDKNKTYEPIKTFTRYEELNQILNKVVGKTNDYLSEIVYPALNYKLSEKMLSENPDCIGRLRTNAFSSLSNVFFETPESIDSPVAMLGILNGKRTIRYIRRDYLLDSNSILDLYNLILAVVNGNGLFGEPFSKAFVAEPGVAYTQSFIAIGRFNSEIEARNVEKYIKTKFCRAMIGVMKATPQCSAIVWKYVPNQDFSNSSDINWSTSITKIDEQLYQKYDLSREEIDFIETNVEEME